VPGAWKRTSISLIANGELTHCGRFRHSAAPKTRGRMNAEPSVFQDAFSLPYSCKQLRLSLSGAERPNQYVVFDQKFALTSKRAMVSRESLWRGQPVVGTKVLVGTQQVPVRVMSATFGMGTRFVMSAPTIGAAGKAGPSRTQTLGLALALAVDRLEPGAWKKHVLGAGGRTLPTLLD